MPRFFTLPNYPFYKLAIVTLLALNVAIFAWLESLTNAVDALVWVLLLVLYELETNGVAPLSENQLRPVRNALIILIVLVFFRYFQESEWLNVCNDLLWFALIALLEMEVRWPDKVLQFRHSYWLATVLVFIGLIAMVVAWAMQSAWLDVYDASLWIVAFGSIEADIFQLLQRKRINANSRT